jgi:hypothetical protein
MILKKGNMFEMWDKCDYFLVTTNSSVRLNGELIMGAGAAKQLRELVPDSPRALGRQIVGKPFYGVVLANNAPIGQTYGGFQTKYDYHDNSTLELIEKSSERLREIMDAEEGYPHLVVMNFPGVGHGKLAREDVLPILEKHFGVCSNVWIYEYE